MDNYGTMNNSYGNIVYSGQISEITQLQNQTVQYQYQQQEQVQYFDALKENQYQERETIITNNVTTEAPCLNTEQVVYQAPEQEFPVAMEEPAPVENHDAQAETLEENHQPEEPATEEPAIETNGQQETMEEEHLEEEKQVSEEVKEEVEKADEVTKEDNVDEAAAEEKKEEIKEEVKDETDKVKVRRKDGTPADLEICRVCQSKEELSDIFEFDTSVRICDLIMKICTNVRIAERDHLPHKICKSCVDKVRIAFEFKTTCEKTDKELRQTLKRSYKSRRTTDFVIVNCPMSDEDENDEEPQDDDEYKVSQSEVESEPVTSDDSFAPSGKKKKTPKRRGRRTRSEPVSAPEPPVKRRRGRQPGYSPKAAAAAKASSSKIATPVVDTPRRRGRPPKNSRSPGLANVVYIEAPDPSSSDSEDDKPIRTRKTHDCTKCDETFNTGVELKEHLQSHKGDLFPCTKCEKTFKSKVYLSNHLERHTQDEKKREEKLKAKEQKKQQQRLKEIQKRKEHEERLKRQKAQAGSAEKKKKLEPTPVGTGRDLFKCVAPLTSTYWSDSFSD
ncbi:gelsolin-related protein of 125 kDa [Armigeres subalbatus]|uniref:gelsolin-related protein of 125 kDa n=1 Tax=Armigeres subalbatus TaxID=124917 RepID=UPI002ED1DED2